MDELTPRERQVLDLLRTGGGRCSLDDLIESISNSDKPVTRQGIIQTIKYMNSKIAHTDGILVVLESGGRGRGNRATYVITKVGSASCKND